MRIIALLVIDIIFFLLELIVGYAVHSLALVADSFHMLNDVMSLIVALWAVRVASQKGADSQYTYGWQRAEILGALVNGVFLLALCLSIFLEAIQRLVSPEVITNPKLILIVGSCGLASNIVGLFLFHEHGHSHGGHDHGHDAESRPLMGDIEGQGHSHSHDDHSHGHSHSHAAPNYSAVQSPESAVESEVDEQELLIEAYTHQRALSGGSDGAAARARAAASAAAEDAAAASVGDLNTHEARPASANCACQDAELCKPIAAFTASVKSSRRGSTASETHVNHFHAKPKGSGQKRTKSMNMEGVFLHVMGDALGNIGVIATALFIWQTDYSWRYHMDPIISLVITVIIFSSALPLCRKSGSVLLQGSPQSINTDEVRMDLESLPGVQDIHDLHIWCLKEDFFVATLHVAVSLDESEFMYLAQKIRTCLYAYGVASITVQPEFIPRSGSSVASGSK